MTCTPPMPPKHETTPEEPDAVTLSERTKVPLGTLLAAFSIIAVFVGTTWYLGTALSEIKTKLDSQTLLLSTVMTKNGSLESKIIDHEREDISKWTAIDTRVSVIEKSGSDKSREIERELNNLKNDFRLHEAMGKQTRTP